MKFRNSTSLLLPFLSIPIITTAAQQAQQVLIQDDAAEPINIAIIGAGAGGSSAAYHLSQYARNHSLPLNITIFERNAYIGGRSTTVDAYEDPLFPVELGASIFVQVNKILQDAVTEFNLSLTDHNNNPKGVPGAALGVWDGKAFPVLLGQGGWWDMAKLLWRYGLAPIKTQRLMKKVVAQFLTMYEEPIFPFGSLTQAAQDSGILDVTATTGEQYMRANGITGPFGREVVQASTRVNYAQNLAYIHGLEAMVCMATDGAVAVQGGNWKIFEAMIKASGATLQLGSKVQDLKQQDDGTYNLLYTTTPAAADNEDITTSLNAQRFDTIILATPYQFSGLPSLSSSEATMTPDTIPYVQLYVTLFTSPHLLSPTFFNLGPTEATPRVILTTLPAHEAAQRGPAGIGSPGFFSISLLRDITNPNPPGRQEYLYKIFSAEPINATFLRSILGIAAPPSDSHTNNTTSTTSSFFEEIEPGLSGDDVSWIYRKIWNSYPYEYPRVTFEDVRLGPKLWYTSGMDGFISTMETNALMGRNVARLIIDEMISQKEETLL